jgi:hypothetical protein
VPAGGLSRPPSTRNRPLTKLGTHFSGFVSRRHRAAKRNSPRVKGGGLKPACSQDWLPHKRPKASAGLKSRARLGLFCVGHASACQPALGRLFPMLSRISRVFAARPVTGTKPEKHFPQRFCGETCSPGRAKACPTRTASLALEQNGQSRVWAEAPPHRVWHKFSGWSLAEYSDSARLNCCLRVRLPGRPWRLP